MHITVWKVYAKSYKVSKLFQCNDLFSSTLHYIRKTRGGFKKKNGFVLRYLSLFSSFWLESSHFLINSGIKGFFLHIGPFPLSKWIGYPENKINDNEFTRDKTEFLLYPLHMFWFLKSQKWSVILTILHLILHLIWTFYSNKFPMILFGV